MPYHILNGDSLAESFPVNNVPGEIIVVRECLIEGEVRAKNLNEFWDVRANHISTTYLEPKDHYLSRVVSEFEKLLTIPDNSELNLWFEHDLFCQVNMWFVISLLQSLPINKKVFVVYPLYAPGNDRWSGFGRMAGSDLINSYDKKIPFSEKDLILGKDLWYAYQNNDLQKFHKLSLTNTLCFPLLKEVCQAHIDRFPTNGNPGRPEKILGEISRSGKKDFYSIFQEFCQKEGIYGFGDSQVKNILERMKLEYK